MSAREPKTRWSLEGAARIRAARYLAVAADALQIAILPLFAPGGFSPWNDALDVAIAAALTRLIGWHWAFLPSFVAELVPGLDLVPTWTAAVFFVTRGGALPGRKVPRDGAVDTEVVSSTEVAQPPPRPNR
jgi:hypothetical protein